MDLGSSILVHILGRFYFCLSMDVKQYAQLLTFEFYYPPKKGSEYLFQTSWMQNTINKFSKAIETSERERDPAAVA